MNINRNWRTAHVLGSGSQLGGPYCSRSADLRIGEGIPGAGTGRAVAGNGYDSRIAGLKGKSFINDLISRIPCSRREAQRFSHFQ
jgi:hypothetical protein